MKTKKITPEYYHYISDLLNLYESNFTFLCGLVDSEEKDNLLHAMKLFVLNEITKVVEAN